MLEQAGLGGNQNSDMAKYLINYFLLGKELGKEPENWNSKLEDIHKKLNWDPKKQTFANLSSQVGVPNDSSPRNAIKWCWMQSGGGNITSLSSPKSRSLITASAAGETHNLSTCYQTQNFSMAGF